MTTTTQALSMPFFVHDTALDPFLSSIRKVGGEIEKQPMGKLCAKHCDHWLLDIQWPSRRSEPN